MIVLPKVQGQGCWVRQMDHAHMSSQIAAAWKRPSSIKPANWERVILAVTHHDDGWEEADAMPMLDAKGEPYDFLDLPTDQHIEIWQRSLTRTAKRDLFAGLLVSLLARKLYHEHGHGGEAEQTFLVELTERIEQQTNQLARGSLNDQAAIQPASLQTAASLLALFDCLSLQMLGAIPPKTTWESVDFGDCQTRLTLDRHGMAFTLDPWPLEKTLALTVQTSQKHLAFTLAPPRTPGPPDTQPPAS